MTYNASGSEFLAHPAAAGTQFFESILALPGGRFAIEYFESVDSVSFPTSLLKARIFDGVVGGSEINPPVAGSKTMLSDGRIVAIESDIFGSLLSAQFLDDNFSAIGDKIEFLSGGSGVEFIAPSVTGITDGAYAMAFAVHYSGYNTSRIYLQTFDPVGKPRGSSVLVANGNMFGANGIATLSDGRIAVLSTYDQTVSVYAANLVGTPQVSKINTAALPSSDMAEAKIVALKDGAFVVVWTEAGSSQDTIHARIFDAAGAMLGDDIVVSPNGPPRYG